MWIGSGKTDVVKDEQFENFRHVHIQWWVLMKKEQRMMENCIMIVGRANGNAIW